LWDQGYTVLCPHANTAHFERRCRNTNYQDYIDGDKELIRGVTALVMLTGWENSKGAKIEKEFAEELGIPIYFYPATPVDLVAKEKADQSILQEAQELIHGVRQKNYGHPWDDFSRTARMWSAIFGVSISPLQVALGMIAVKISRLCKTPDHRDSQTDIAGYIGTYEMVLQKQKELEDKK
jgi:hypothetical protein